MERVVWAEECWTIGEGGVDGDDDAANRGSEETSGGPCAGLRVVACEGDQLTIVQ